MSWSTQLFNDALLQGVHISSMLLLICCVHLPLYQMFLIKDSFYNRTSPKRQAIECNFDNITKVYPFDFFRYLNFLPNFCNISSYNKLRRRKNLFKNVLPPHHLWWMWWFEWKSMLTGISFFGRKRKQHHSKLSQRFYDIKLRHGFKSNGKEKEEEKL